MAFDPNSLTEDDVIGHGTNGSDSMMGLDAPLGFYKGKRLKDVGTEFCNIARWIKDNTPWTASVEMAFTDENSTVRVRLFRQSDGTVAKVFGPKVVTTGGQKRTGNFADRHEAMGTIAIRKVAQRIEAQLISDGVL